MTSHYLLNFFNDSGYAGLEADEGFNLMVPVAWLPAGVGVGSRLTVTLSSEANVLIVRLEAEGGDAAPELLQAEEGDTESELAQEGQGP